MSKKANLGQALKKWQVTTSDTVNSEYYSELIQDCAEETLLSGQSRIQALEIEHGKTGVFTISAGDLYLLIQAEKGPDGWRQINCTNGKYGHVSSFNVSPIAKNGTCRVAFGGSKNSNPQLYVSADVKLTELNHDQFESNALFTAIPLMLSGGGSPQGGLISDVSLLNSFGIATWLPGDNSAPVIFQMDDTGSTTELIIPDSDTVIQTAMGQLGTFDQGVFALFTKSGSEQTYLQFFPCAGGSPTQYTLPSSEDQIACFSTGLSKASNSLLYVAGAGLYEFATDGSQTCTVIADPVEGQTTAKLVLSVEASSGVNTLWANITPPNKAAGLFMLTDRNASETPSWTKPVQLQRNIVDFSPLSGKSFVNQLFFISDEKGEHGAHLRHFWQPVHSTIWTDVPVTTHGNGKMRSFGTFTNFLKFSTTNPHRTFAGTSVMLKPDSSLFAVVNGKACTLTPENPLDITLDSSGMISIVVETSSLAGANITASADFLNQDVSMALTQKVPERLREKLGATKSQTAGQRLMAATRQDAKGGTQPLIPSSIKENLSDQSADAIASGILYFLTVGDYLTGKSTTPQPFSMSVTRASNGNPPTASIGTDEQTQAIIHKHRHQDSLVGDLDHLIGDTIHTIENFVEDVIGIVVEVVENVVKFTITIGKDVFNFVVDAIEQVFAFIEFCFKVLEIAFEAIIEFIGLIFCWGEVKDTKNAIVAMITNYLTQFEGAADTILSDISQWLEQHTPTTVSASLTERVKSAASYEPGDQSGLLDQDFTQIFDRTDTSMTLDAKQFWILNKLPAALGAQIRLPDNLAEHPLLSDLETVLKQVLQCAEQVGGDVVALVTQTISFLQGKLTLDAYLKAISIDLVAVLFQITALAVELTQDVIDLVFDFLNKLLGYVIDIPFFSAFYKRFLSGDELTPLDFGSLVLAIPLTVTYKIALGVPPIGDGQDQFTQEEFAALPANFFAPPNDNGQILTAESASSGQKYDLLYDAIIATTRLVRIFTFNGVNVLAIIPPEKKKKNLDNLTRVQIPESFDRALGLSEHHHAWLQWGLILADGGFRAIGQWTTLLQGSTKLGSSTPEDVKWKNWTYSLFYSLSTALSLFGCPGKAKAVVPNPPVDPADDMISLSNLDIEESFKKHIAKFCSEFVSGKDLRKLYLRSVGVGDGILTFSQGVWGIVDTSIHWDSKSGFKMGSQISMEVFQIPAILSPWFNFAAATIGEDTDGATDALAAIVLFIRDFGLISGTVLEYETIPASLVKG